MADSNESGVPLETAVELVGRTAQLRGQTVHTGVKLGVVDALDEGSKTAEKLSSKLGLPRDYASRLLRALDVYGVLHEDDGRYALTSVGERFLSDHPESVRDYLLFYYNPKRFAAIRHLPEIISRGGPSGYELEFGKSIFEIFDEDPTFSDQFNGMQNMSWLRATEQILDTLDAVDFSKYSTVCDVGGGDGELLSHLLERHPQLEGIILELPSVLDDEEGLWAPKLGVENRCTYSTGDMFEEVPPADAYILKRVLHCWPDEECVQILSNVHDAAPEDGRLFVRDRIVSETDPDPGMIDMDMWMMLEIYGQERTRAEFEALFERAGWVLDGVMTVGDGLPILDCSIS